MNQTNSAVGFCPELLAATGKCDFTMTNDYMFRAVLQSNNRALKGLISSLLRIPPNQILSVEITNPIILGEACSEKEFRLDINLVLNDDSHINLEMQVLDYADWPERSLSYLCRSFDQLCRGERYGNIKPVIHISILDFTLFKDAPEFYAGYRMMNVKTGKIYSSKFILNVLDLKCIERATNEDKIWHTDYWARLFKSRTWEEMKMIAKNNEYLTEASNSIYRLNADEQTRKRCRDREDYYRDMEYQKQQLEEKDNTIMELKDTLAQKDIALSEKDALIDELRKKLGEDA